MPPKVLLQRQCIPQSALIVFPRMEDGDILLDALQSAANILRKLLEFEYETAAASEKILDRTLVALEALDDEVANSLILDAVRCALPEMEQARKPLLVHQFEEVEALRDRPAVRPDRRREKHDALNVVGTLACQSQGEHRSSRQTANDNCIASRLEIVVRGFDCPVPILPRRKTYTSVRLPDRAEAGNKRCSPAEPNLARRNAIRWGSHPANGRAGRPLDHRG